MQTAFLTVYGSPFLQQRSQQMLIEHISWRTDALPHEGSIEIVNGSFAVASESERVRHVARSVFTQIEGMLAVVRMIRVAVRHYHLRDRNSPEDLHEESVDS